MNSKTAIIDYGMGNLTSVQKALQFVGSGSELVNDARELKNYDKFILPGVGAFGQAMQNISGSGIKEALDEEILNKKKPVLGLCLGMQLMLSSSDEHGRHAGFNWIEGEVKNLKELVRDLPVPHVGWNDVDVKPGSILLKQMPLSGNVFYFVHSYACFCKEREVVTGTLDYGVRFDVVFEQNNIFGCQFHPEKSQESGLQVLRNFMRV